MLVHEADAVLAVLDNIFVYFDEDLAIDRSLASDVALVFELLTDSHHYIDLLGFEVGLAFEYGVLS